MLFLINPNSILHASFEKPSITDMVPYQEHSQAAIQRGWAHVGSETNMGLHFYQQLSH